MSLAEVNLAVVMIYGPIGAACAWIVLRADRKTIVASREVVSELRRLSHRIDGLMRAHLISTLAQHDLDPKLRAFGETLLEQEENRDGRTNDAR